LTVDERTGPGDEKWNKGLYVYVIVLIGAVPNTALSRTVDLLFMTCDAMKAMIKPKNSIGY
jgi:hypothetical protein